RQRADAFDFTFDNLSVVDDTDARRGAGQDHISGQQGERFGDVGHEAADIEDHVFGVAVLAEIAVYPGPDLQVVWVEFGFDPGAKRAGSVKAFGTSPLVFSALHVAGGEVVGDRVPKDDVIDAFDRNVFGDPADH